MMNVKCIGIAIVLLSAGCSVFKPTGLYEYTTPVVSNDGSINGFGQTAIFKDDFSADLWFTKEPNCLKVTQERSTTESGSGAIHIEWNKQAGGCPWLGMGIGWDGWTGKDVSQILNDAALSFYVKTKGKPMKALPWAIGFEDFAGNQKWIGVTEQWVVSGTIGDQWSQIRIPLSAFYLDKSAVDYYSIKQLMFQFESNGEVYVDRIELISITPQK